LAIVDFGLRISAAGGGARRSNDSILFKGSPGEGAGAYKLFLVLQTRSYAHAGAPGRNFFI
jgi:hypothetical protein